jgi:hypothetical protein
MKNPFKLSKKENCFLCSGPLGKHPGEIVYKYADGEGKVRLCSPCMDKVEEKPDEQTI